MWAREFVRGMKYDAVPRTTVPIELFNLVVTVTFDTMPATKSQYVNCTECVVITLKSLQPVMRRPCRVKADD